MNAQATQMESLAPRPCEDCKGTGTVIVRGCGHQGNCPCGEDREFPCPRCDGSKVEACDHCGNPATTRYLAQDLCDVCAPSEERRFDRCSICERPIDIRESRLPLCPRCEQTARAHARLERDRREWDRERGAA